MEPLDIDWDKGLPLDILSLVAKTGGLVEMKVMREVSSRASSWGSAALLSFGPQVQCSHLDWMQASASQA